jgi:hypothetical protein
MLYKVFGLLKIVFMNQNKCKNALILYLKTMLLHYEENEIRAPPL